MAVMWRAIKFWAFALVLIGAAAALGYLYWGRAQQTSYLTAPVSQGPGVRRLTVTGRVIPLTAVQVGAYVSGSIQAIYADFNSAVKAGQLIAKIDPRTFKFQVDQAHATVENYRAQLAKDRADLAYKKLTYERDIQLVRNNTISQDTADTAQSAYRMAEAQVGLDRAAIKQWQAAPAQAEGSPTYTNILSPGGDTGAGTDSDHRTDLS